MFTDELAFANEVADEADRLSSSFFRGDFEWHHKPDLTPVTEADTKVETMIRAALAERYPGDAILGEEEGISGESNRVWVIDPIDGTKNFTDGIQIWGTLLSLSVDGESVMGIASAPALGERYAAARGQGATLNGEQIRVRETATLEEALLAFGGIEVWVGEDYRERFTDLVLAVRRTRGVGDFWGHLLVARGSADIMIEPHLRTWDWSAPKIIVEEAGGRTTQIDGSPCVDLGSALSTNGPLHDEMIRRLGS